MLHYALLHLTGYDLPIGELAKFRQLHSRTPGHPETGLTRASKPRPDRWGRDWPTRWEWRWPSACWRPSSIAPASRSSTITPTWWSGDGCLMEGISHEAASLAGTWKLGKLIAIYDDNGISIDGEVRHWFTDDSALRFRAYQWDVIGPIDGHDPAAADIAIAQAKHSDRPTLIIARTVIGKGSPNRAGSEKAHGEALGEAEVAATRQAIGWPHPPFQVPPQIYQAWDARAVGADRERTWRTLFEQYAARHPREAAEFGRRTAGDLPPELPGIVHSAVVAAQGKRESVATRKASQLALEVLAEAVPELIGGSAI